MRKTKQSVTCFLHCGDQYLFVHRDANRTVDPNRLNGIGGKREPEENFLTCALRETQEETGYVVTEADCKLAAVASLEGGYADDWVMCFFKISVPTMDIPFGATNDEGDLMWLHKDEVLTSKYEVVDDLNHCFETIANSDVIQFFTAVVNDDEKIERIQLKKL